MAHRCTPCAIPMLMLMLVGVIRGDDETAEAPTDLAVHDLSIWISDPVAQKLNAADRFATGLPSLVPSPRRRLREDDSYLVPLGLMTFYGEAQTELDVELGVDGGRFVAHWPPARSKSTRLRWLSVSMSHAIDADQASRVLKLLRAHWFDALRQFPALYLGIDERRVERFLAYDVELHANEFLTVQDGPDCYKLLNQMEWPLFDVCIVSPMEDGVRIGWLDELPARPKPPDEKKDAQNTENESAGKEQDKAVDVDEIFDDETESTVEADQPSEDEGEKSSERPETEKPETPADAPAMDPTELTMSERFERSGPSWQAASVDEWTKRLATAGLHEHEIALLKQLYASTVFEPDALIVLARLSPQFLDKHIPLEIYPECDRSVRVGHVIVLNMDPVARADVDRLIADLGHADYLKRESAEQQLMKLGGMAYRSLNQALESENLEIVYRAERILLYQGQQVAAKPSKSTGHDESKDEE